MTKDTKIIERIATFMGWDWSTDESTDDEDITLYFTRGRNDTIHVKAENWNPLQDWNHWRQVEERIMESPIILSKFLQNLSTDNKLKIEDYMKSTLSDRCTALLNTLPKDD